VNILKQYSRQGSKPGGGTRPLGFPTGADRVAQEVARRYVEPRLEPGFHADSYGYRPGKSTIEAARQARQRRWRYDWVLDLDLKAYFDSIDWKLLLRAVLEPELGFQACTLNRAGKPCDRKRRAPAPR
jgi:retron-type reverse transcriptase